MMLLERIIAFALVLLVVALLTLVASEAVWRWLKARRQQRRRRDESPHERKRDG